MTQNNAPSTGWDYLECHCKTMLAIATKPGVRDASLLARSSLKDCAILENNQLMQYHDAGTYGSPAIQLKNAAYIFATQVNWISARYVIESTPSRSYFGRLDANTLGPAVLAHA